MKLIRNIHEYSVYLFAFSLSFEKVNLFGLGIDYLASKIAIMILLFTSILNYGALDYDWKRKKIIVTILSYFVFLTAVNYLNKSSISYEYFDILLFLNLAIFTILGGGKYLSNSQQLKRLIVFAAGNISLLILYYLGIGVGEYAGRATIFSINQNMLGVSFVMTFFILFSLIYEGNQYESRLRYLLIPILAIVIIFIASTGSRVSLISLIVGLAIFMVFKRTKTKSIKKAFYLIIAMVGAYILWKSLIIHTIGGQRLMESIIYGDSAYRDKIWDTRYNEILDNPFFGVGTTGYLELHPNQSPHNVFLEVFYYTGIIGFILFIIFYLNILKTAFIRLKKENYLLPIMLLVPITGMLISGQIFEHKYIWFILAFIAFPGLIDSKFSRPNRGIPNQSGNDE